MSSPQPVLRCEHKVECVDPAANKINYSSGRDMSLRGPAGGLSPVARIPTWPPPAKRSTVDYFNWTKPMKPPCLTTL